MLDPAPDIDAEPQENSPPETSERLSKDIFKNAIRYEYVLDTFSTASLGTAFALVVLITAAPGLLQMVMPSVLDNTFAPGFEAGLHRAEGVLVWTLCVLQLPAMLVSRYMLTERRSREFYTAYWLQSMLQFTWLQMLAFYTVPMFPLIGVALLIGLFFSWAFSDSLGMYDSAQIKRQYLLAFPLFDLALLGVDLAGERGLIYAWQTSQHYFFNILTLQVCLVLLTQALISAIGRQVYEHDVRLTEQSLLLKELAVMKAERKVIQRTCGLLTQGLTATKFSHDVASPLMVLQHSVDELRRELGPPDPTRRRGVLAPNWKKLDRAQENLAWAAEQINAMTQGMARSVRDVEATELQSVELLLKRALSAMQTTLRGHGVDSPALDMMLEPSKVAVTGGHISAIANILSNGVQQAPEQALEVRGSVANRWFYLLSIRDFGVDPEARPEAVRSVLGALSMGEGEVAPRRGSYKGFGLGLMMAKILFVRHNGWLGVAIPDAGPGLVMNIVLPRCPVAEIPDAENQPERVAEGAGVEELSLTDIPLLDAPSPVAS